VNFFYLLMIIFLTLSRAYCNSLLDNNIGDQGAIALAASLRVNTSLRSLDLEDNNIGGEGGAALISALRDNWSLTELM